MTLNPSCTPAEFIDWLRDWAVAGNAKPILIDKIDELQALENNASEIEKRDAEITDLEDSRDAVLDALKSIVNAIERVMDDRDLADRITAFDDETRTPRDGLSLAHALKEALNTIEREDDK